MNKDYDMQNIVNGFVAFIIFFCLGLFFAMVLTA